MPARSPWSTWSTRLRAGGFVLLDAQFVTDHLQRFGAVEISRSTYLRRLRRALAGRRPDFPRDAYPSAGAGPGTGVGRRCGRRLGSGSSGSAQPTTQTS